MNALKSVARTQRVKLDSPGLKGDHEMQMIFLVPCVIMTILAIP